MTIDKLSVSMEQELAAVVREAAAQDGVSLSAWLSVAAHDRIRNRLLRRALDAEAVEFGSITSGELSQLVADAYRDAIVIGPKTSRRRSA